MRRQTPLLLTGAILPAVLAFVPAANGGEWISGDFHQHTTYTDGAYSFAHMMAQSNAFGLDWWANSEHGGGFTRDAFGADLPLPQFRYWDDSAAYPGLTILGDAVKSGGHQVMWRWQSIRDFSFPDVLNARTLYPDRIIIQGLEWNVPGHEHCSTAILAGQFDGQPLNADAVAEFEYRFDNSDKDTTGGAAQGWVKSALSGHAKAVEAAAWMQANFAGAAWMIIAHPERKGYYLPPSKTGYNIESFRDLNNAGPDVCFGFESMPGHQQSSDRGGYSSSAAGAGTYGGCGIYAARIGGLWDALLGEGRQWWLFASSDAHSTADTDGDFYPGEYQKTWTCVDERSPLGIVRGLRSGNSFVVEGDLIDELDFHIKCGQQAATMGQALTVPRGEKIKVTIRFRSPKFNNNGDAVRVDHVDLICGDVTGLIDPSHPDYTKATHESTRVIQRFDGKKWSNDKGWCVMKCELKAEKDMYFRLRGTNVAVNTPFETDADGNPLLDTLATVNLGLDKGEEAWADLWFYSNPVFVDVQ